MDCVGGDRGQRFRTMDPGWVADNVPALLAVAADQPDEYWTAEHFLAERPGKWTLSFAVLDEEGVVAYVVASLSGPGAAHIHHFMVRPGHRGRGLGTRMLAEIERRACAAGAKRIGAKARRDNEGAKRFYVRHGFTFSEISAEYQSLDKPLEGFRPAIVAIHQPNYLPWLGYFAKIARADMFVFLDDVQFSKGSYTNRVQILSPRGPRWLTVPVAAHLGDPINRVSLSRRDWASAHLDTLRGMYASAPHFKTVWPAVRGLLESVPAGGDLATVNMHLVRELAGLLGLACTFRRSSDLALVSAADERLVEIVSRVAPGGTYLSGKGGAKYQDPAKFVAAGLGFAYLGFVHPTYAQGSGPFQSGLSVLDEAFCLGWEGAAALFAGEGERG